MKLRAMSCAAGLGMVLTFPAASLADGAEPFQNELGFSFGQNSDSDDTFETTTIQFDAVHYLQPVNVMNHPLAEAAFLERAASVSFHFAQTTTDVNGGFFSFSVDQTQYSAQLDYASTTSPLTFTAAYMGTKFTSDDVDVDLSGNEFGFKIGSYVGNANRIQAIFSQMELEDTTGTVVGLEAKSVHELDNNTALVVNGTIFSAESSSNDGSSNGHGYKLDIDYYTSQMTNIGFTREWQTNKDQDGTFDGWAHHFRIKHFLSSKASIAFEYLNTDADSDTDGFNVIFALRI